MSISPHCLLIVRFLWLVPILIIHATGDDQGKPYVLPSVRAAEEKIVASRLDKEYAGITGIPSFTKAAAELAYGADSPAIKEDRLAITQSISGTGALRIGGAFLARFYPHAKKIYIPTPSWANHKAVFTDSGLEVVQYRYYNKDTIGLDFDGLIEDLRAAPNRSIILLHACAHNPTGVDPTEAQWRQISDVIKEKEHFAFFDMAYQGFASGDADRDAFAPRHFVKEGHNIALCQSFAKNMVSSNSRPEEVEKKESEHRLTEAGPVRRACRRLLPRLRERGGEEARGVADQDPRPSALLQPSRPRRAHRVHHPERPAAVQAVAGRGQGHGGPHHRDACPAEEEPGGAGQQA